MSVTGVGSCVRGEVTRFLLSKGVCRGLYQLKQLIGRKPFTSLHTPVSTGVLTPSPLDIISFYANSRQQDNVGKTGRSRLFPSACF